MIYVVQFGRFFIRTVLAVALTFACLGSGIAQAQDLTAHESSAAENNSSTEASKQAANPLASVWLMQFQHNNTWIGMPANGGNRAQSNLQFAGVSLCRAGYVPSCGGCCDTGSSTKHTTPSIAASKVRVPM